MFGEANIDEKLSVILDNYSLEDILEKLEIDSMGVLRLLNYDNYDLMSIYEEIVNGG